MQKFIISNDHEKPLPDEKKCHSCTQCSFKSKNPSNLKTHVGAQWGEAFHLLTVYSIKLSISNNTDWPIQVTNLLVAHYVTIPFEQLLISRYTCQPTRKKKPFKCYQCDYSWENPFKCNHCSYSGKRAFNLKEHMRQHTGEKPFKCDQCDYSCAHGPHLKVHKRKHTAEEPYKYSSKTTEGMKYHMLSHSGQKPFSCNQCDYPCKTSSQLKKRAKRHNLGPNA